MSDLTPEVVASFQVNVARFRASMEQVTLAMTAMTEAMARVVEKERLRAWERQAWGDAQTVTFSDGETP